MRAISGLVALTLTFAFRALPDHFMTPPESATPLP